jgi:hypothetical protein
MPPAPETAPAPLQAAEPASDPIFDQPRIRPPRESRYAAILHKLDESPERADAFNNTGHTDMAALLRSQGWR